MSDTLTIFIASSGEAKRNGRSDQVAAWIEELGHKPLPWYEDGVFEPGSYTLDVLMALSSRVDAAIFVCTPDDKAWMREEVVLTPRDNVLLEYGLFLTALGHKRAAIMSIGEVNLPTDVAGLTILKYPELNHTAKNRFRTWLGALPQTGAPSSGLVPYFTNKYSMPNPNAFWRDQIERPVRRLSIVGTQNKSWLQRNPDQCRVLASTIVRLVNDGGRFEILSLETAKPSVVGFFKKFVFPVVQKLSTQDRKAWVDGIENRLIISFRNSIQYKAVISDNRLLLLPAMMSGEFNDEALVFEFDGRKHRDQFLYYSQDVDRAVLDGIWRDGFEFLKGASIEDPT